MTSVLANVEAELTNNPPVPAPGRVEPIDKYVPAKYRSASGDTMEAIQQDMRRTAADMEKALEGFRKRFEYAFDNMRATIDEMKRLAG